jgi:hypothetical protein
MLAPTKRPKRGCVSVLSSEDKTDIISEMLCFIEFTILDDGEFSEIQ